MSTTKELWLGVILLPALSLFTATMCLWQSPRFLGTVAMLLIFMEPFLFLAIIVALLATPVLLVLGLVRWKQPGQLFQGLSRAGACLAIVALGLATAGYANVWRHNAFARAAIAGDQIVNALARFHQDKQAYPDSLDELIPDYLPELPYTGLIGYPRFEYRRDYYDIEPRPGEYELSIPCPSGGINFDRFIYWPSETYPARIQGNGVEPIGRWAYIHE